MEGDTVVKKHSTVHMEGDTVVKKHSTVHMEGHLKLRLVFLSYLFVAKKFIKVLYAIKT